MQGFMNVKRATFRVAFLWLNIVSLESDKERIIRDSLMMWKMGRLVVFIL